MLNEEAKVPNDNPKADVAISVTDELDAADAAVISDGLRAHYVSQLDTTIFARSLSSSGIRRPARSSAGSTDGPNSVSFMSPGSFCPRIGAELGSAAGCWRWRKKRVDDAAVVGSR